MYYPGFRYRQRSSAYFEYTDKSHSRSHLGSGSTLSDGGSSTWSLSHPPGRLPSGRELPSPLGRRKARKPHRRYEFNRSISAPVTPMTSADHTGLPYSFDKLWETAVSRLSTPSYGEDEKELEERPPSSLPDRFSSHLATSSCSSTPGVHRSRSRGADASSELSMDIESSHSRATSMASGFESQPESLASLPFIPDRINQTQRRRFAPSVVAAVSAVDAPDGEDAPRPPAAATGRRRSVTWQMDMIDLPAVSENVVKRPSPKPRRPSTLSITQTASPTVRRKSSGGISARDRSGSVVSASSRSSAASNLYGKPPLPYASDVLKFRRASVNSTTTMETVASSATELSAFIRDSPTSAPANSPISSPLPPPLRSRLQRRKSIDATFQWGTDLQPTTIECCALSYTLLPKAITLPGRLLRRFKQACTESSQPGDGNIDVEAGSMQRDREAAADLSSRQLLKGVTFRADTGSLVAVLGPTGMYRKVKRLHTFFFQ